MNKAQKISLGITVISILGIIVNSQIIDDRNILGMDWDARNKLFAVGALVGGVVLIGSSINVTTQQIQQ